jgi:hypothetical protein
MIFYRNLREGTEELLGYKTDSLMLVRMCVVHCYTEMSHHPEFALLLFYQSKKVFLVTVEKTSRKMGIRDRFCDLTALSSR